MSQSDSTSSSQTALNLRAIGMMVVAMFGFALADTLIRIATLGVDGTSESGASVALLLFTQGAVGVLIFGFLMLRSGSGFSWDLLTDKLVIMRSLSDVIAATFIITSLSLMSVGSVSAIMQVQPLLITLGAVFFLKETVSWRRWSAVLVGFIGVMIIIRPGSETFSWNVVYVLLGVLGLTCRDLVTRLVDKRYSSYALVTLVSLLLFPIAALLHFINPPSGELSPEIMAYTLASSITAMLAYFLLTVAMRIGEVSVIAPYRYSRLIAAFLVAYLLLGEKPDAYTVLGGIIVIAAGIYVLYRERVTSS